MDRWVAVCLVLAGCLGGVEVVDVILDVNAARGMPQCPSDDGGFGVGCVELGSNDLCLVCPSGCLPENFYPPGGVEPDGGPLAAGVCTEALGEGAGVMWCVVPPDAGK